MANIREILTDWTLPSGSGHVSVMYFNPADPIATQRTNLHTFWTAVKAFQSTGTIYVIRTTGRELDVNTGVLTGAWSEASVKNGAGGAGSVSVPDADQALLQWRTPTIVNGRFLRGRTFVPGLGIGHTSGGNVLPTTATALAGAAAALVGSATPPHVWHRPIAGSGGQSVAANTVTCWSEFAILRRRRH